MNRKDRIKQVARLEEVVERFARFMPTGIRRFV